VAANQKVKGEIMLRIIIACALAAIFAMPATADETTTKQQLIGTWKFINLKATNGNEVSYPFGEKVTGYVTYTPDRIWVLVVDSTREPLRGEGVYGRTTL
jgi:Lipocalin-like domain